MARALSLARTFADDAALSDEAADSLSLIVEEWLNNVVEHGGAAPGGRIVLRLQRTPELLRVAVSDAGLPFDPRTTVFSGPNLQRGGGVGLALIRAWCRISSYRRHGGRNRVVFEVLLK